jgi:hypothetical protein
MRRVVSVSKEEITRRDATLKQTAHSAKKRRTKAAS